FEDAHFSSRVKNCARALARRRSAALAELFDLVGPRSVRYARALTRRQHDAEDALQAAVVRVALYPQGMAEAEHSWAYLLRFVRLEAHKNVRKGGPDEGAPRAAEAGSEDPSIDSGAGQRVNGSRKNLPASQSEVVVLKIWEGMTFAEIADVLGESPNTAASRYRYALAKLSQFLEPLAEEVRCV